MKRGNSMTLLLSDIDHTLFNDALKISPRNLEAINSWTKNPQNAFYLCSGRNLDSLLNIKKKYNLNCNLIALNGALITDNKNNVIQSFPFKSSSIQPLIDFCEQHKLIYIIYTEKSTFARFYLLSMVRLYQLAHSKSNQLKKIIYFMGQYYRSFYSRHTHLYHSFNPGNNTQILKFEMFSSKPQLLKKAMQIAGTGLACTQSSPWNLEVTSKEATKGNALNFVKNYTHQKSTVAIGDGQNDISMFDVADYSIAMQNASQTVKNHADFITNDNNHDGFANGINHFLKTN